MVQFFAIKDGGLVLSEFKPAAHNDGSVWLLSSRTEERETAASLKRPAQTISTHVLPAVWERHDPAAARSQNEALSTLTLT